jgi:hypothetical protein
MIFGWRWYLVAGEQRPARCLLNLNPTIMRIRFDAQAVFEVGCLNWSNIMVDWGARRSVDPGVLRFSYVCHACNRCCRNEAIRVSPYEILRLAR